MEEREGRREEHPLTNPLVVRTLLACDDEVSKEVIRNRRVCRSWRDESLAEWLKLNKHPRLTYSTPIMADNNGEQLMTLGEMHHLWRLGSPSIVGVLGVPPTKLWLQSWGQEYAGSMESSALDEWFWNWAATAHLTSVTLAHCQFEECVPVFEEPFLRALPSLQQLTLQDCVVDSAAVARMREAHELWAQQPGRREYRRKVMDTGCTEVNELFTTVFNRADLCGAPPRAEQNFDGFQHSHLRCLDVTLRALDNGDPLLFWGPLLEKLPRLRELRLGGDCDEENAPAFLQISDTHWINAVCYLNGISQGYQRAAYRYMKFTSLEHCPCATRPVSRPPHGGNYFPLFWEDTIRQVAHTLESLDLLDFRGRAQEEGVLSACFLADGPQIDPLYQDLSNDPIIFPFTRLCRIAIDLGIDPVGAERDMTCLILGRTRMTLRHLTLFRAPFAEDLPRMGIVADYLTTLEIWGNVITNWGSFYHLRNLKVLRWNTRCYDAQHKGKRVRHLLEKGRKAWPLFTQDLVAKDAKIRILPFPTLRELDIDWGGLSLESWSRLAERMPGLDTLKAVLTEDGQLERVAHLWPQLVSLRLNHRSQITTATLQRILPRFSTLTDFTWEGCSCLYHLFADLEECQSVKDTLRKTRPNTNFTLPWASGTPSLVCEEAQFEKALLDAAKDGATPGKMTLSALQERIDTIDKNMEKLAKEREMLKSMMEV